MILYHATPKRNLEQIERQGLDPNRATGKIKGVWLHTASKSAWAILHTIKRYDLKTFDEVAILKCNVPRRYLTRRWRGLWTTDRLVIDFEVVDVADIAASPLDTDA